MAHCSICGVSCSGLGRCARCGEAICYTCARFPTGLREEASCDRCNPGAPGFEQVLRGEVEKLKLLVLQGLRR